MTGAFSAFSGKDGALLWRVKPESITKTPFPYNFYTPAVINDANGDGVVDLIVVHGGDDTKMPGQPRDSGYVAVISGADGAVLKVLASPDHNELYAAPIVYQRPAGAQWLILGTGAKKGVIAPPTLVELTGDAEPDIVVNTFDGRLVVVDGATGKTIWQRVDANEEAYHQPAVVRLAPDGQLGLFVSRGIGAFPKYVGTTHRLLDARTGALLHEYRDPNYPAGAPLAVDLNGDGFDEPFFFTTRFPTAQGARIHILDRAAGKLITHDVATNYWTGHCRCPRQGHARADRVVLDSCPQFGHRGVAPAPVAAEPHGLERGGAGVPGVGWLHGHGCGRTLPAAMMGDRQVVVRSRRSIPTSPSVILSSPLNFSRRAKGFFERDAEAVNVPAPTV